MELLPDRLPLVIGVTRHCDLRDQDVAQLAREVSTIIARLRHDYLGRKGEAPIIILSALAEGADRLAARVALAQGAHLIAPLPMPLDEYRRDFEPGLKPGNIAEFEALFAQAIAAPVMPLHGTSLETLRADRKKRAEQYRAVGIFIAQHCHVLLALWDGDNDNMAMGGSAEVVTFKRHGIPLRVSGSPRADEPGSGGVSSARSRASSDALCARTLEWPRWPLASLASAARADEPGSGRVSGARTLEWPRWPLASLASAASSPSGPSTTSFTSSS